jgi:hypothetical protein
METILKNKTENTVSGLCLETIPQIIRDKRAEMGGPSRHGHETFRYLAEV